MKFIAIVQAFNEMPENLPRCVASARRLCHEVVGYDDGSTDGTGAWMDANLDHVFHGERNEWKEEIRHKHLMLEEARRRGADWVLWIDCDEELSPPAVAAIPRAIGADPALTGVCIPEINLWRDRQHYRVDAQFWPAGFLRLWRVRPELRYTEDQVEQRSLHRPQFPDAAREKMVSLEQPDHVLGVVGEPMVHYSWDSPEKIAAKYARYAAQGQDGWALERLRDTPDAVLAPARPEWFWPKP